MCIGPSIYTYLIPSIFFLTITLLFYYLPTLKKYNNKYIKTIKIILTLITIIFIILFLDNYFNPTDSFIPGTGLLRC